MRCDENHTQNKETNFAMTNETTTTEASSSNPSPILDLGDIGVGLMQWGTTHIDERMVNPKGNLTDETVQELWKTCREQKVVFFDTAEGEQIS